MTTPSLIILVAAAVICARLLTYRRGDSHHSYLYSITAWLLIAGTGTATIRILLGHYPCANSWGIALVMAVFAVLVIRAEGNVAHVIKLRRI